MHGLAPIKRRRSIARGASAVVALLGILLAALLVNALRLRSRQVDVTPAEKMSLDEMALAERLAQALRFRTISHQEPGRTDRSEFLNLIQFFEDTYPRVHASLRLERVNDLSLLYTWPGTDPSLRPILLMAHLDVVPVEPGSEGKWKYPAFEGRIAEGYVWGRGAMDDKVGVLAILEAVDLLLAAGYRPRRSIYFAFGHDEEVSGHAGAARIAELLGSRDVHLDFVIDEGSAGTRGVLPMLDAPLALVGTAEKGYLTLELSVSSEGGHSSMPPPQTAAGIVAAAVTALQESPMPARLAGPAEDLLLAVSPELSLGRRLVLANLWLFGPMIKWQLSQNPSSNATLRTTTAPTMMEGSAKENVLPQRARAVVNFRILPGDSVSGVLQHAREVIDDPRVEIKALGVPQEPSARSSTQARGFGVLSRTIREIFPGAVVAPALVLGATDARHYAAHSDDVYRFLPLWVTPEDLSRIHGTNERISVEGFAQCVRFYRQLLLNADG